jgi:EAL domain-containing protein (putative c-di-GMP-specific phosphodiesterase class I)/CheY-like chemotaxis protein
MIDSKTTNSPGSGLPPQGLQGRRVLVVEDSLSQRAFAVDLVRAMGSAEVSEAANGVEALSILETESGIDMVFCDLEMPRMDGVALIGEMAARSINPYLVILSSHEAEVLETVRIMAVTYGISPPAVIAKPLSQEKIEQVLAAFPFRTGAGAPGRHAQDHPSFTDLEIRRGMKRGEFECFFQPQISMREARLDGAEALARWRHPELGILGPASFLPQIEQHPEIMSRFTLKILEQIARHWHEWHGAGLDLELSVNLSAASLSMAGFADRILETVSRLGVAPTALVLEITESASASNLGHTLANLARLRMRGFKLSIDDFGTGYATYAQLQRIPFTELKIDISVTRELPRSRRHTILAKSLLQLAKDFHLRTVAEGIETLECWKALKGLGCDRGQGYFLGRPMPAGVFLDWSRQDPPPWMTPPCAQGKPEIIK